MTLFKPSQASFVAGEISPSLQSRTDLAQYKAGLKLSENAFVHGFGGVSTRAGFQYVGEVASSSDRLITFNSTPDISYTIVLGTDRTSFKVARDREGVTVHTTTGFHIWGESVGAAINYPYTNSDHLSQLKYGQSGTDLYIVHPNYPIFKLYMGDEVGSNVDENHWTLEQIAIGSTLPQPTTVAPVNATSTPSPSFTCKFKVTSVNLETLEESDPKIDNVSAGDYVEEGDATDKITITITQPSDVTDIDAYFIYKLNTSSSSTYDFDGYVYQSGVGGTDVTFVDGGIDPKAGDTPPVNMDPFDSDMVQQATAPYYIQSPPEAPFKFPATVGFFAQRMLLGATNERPKTFWASQVGGFQNFDRVYPYTSNKSLMLTLDKCLHLRNFVSLNDLMFLTEMGEWKMTVGAGGFTPTTIRNDQQSAWGSSEIIPVIVGNTFVFIDRENKRLRNLTYSMEAGTYKSNELTTLVPHLFIDRSIADFTYQKGRDSIMWATMDDGTLLGCTYMPEEGVVAWHRHDTNGLFKSSTTVATDTVNDFYIIVEREIPANPLDSVSLTGTTGVVTLTTSEGIFASTDIGKTISSDDGGWGVIVGYTSSTVISMNISYNFGATSYLPGECYMDPYTVNNLEVLGDNVCYGGDVYDCSFTDSSVTKTGLINKVLTLSDKTVGTGRTAMAGGGAFTSDDVGQYIRIKDGGSAIITAYTSAVTVTVDILAEFDKIIYPANTWYLSFSTVEGLDHLGGSTVKVFVDGSLAPDKKVVLGSITLDHPAIIAHVGLGFTSKINTLDLNVATKSGGTYNTNKKTIPKINIRVDRSLGFWAGPTEENLVQSKQELLYYDTPTGLYSGIWELVIPNKWSTSGSVWITQPDPLPLTVLSIDPEVMIGKG